MGKRWTREKKGEWDDFRIDLPTLAKQWHQKQCQKPSINQEANQDYEITERTDEEGNYIREYVVNGRVLAKETSTKTKYCSKFRTLEQNGKMLAKDVIKEDYFSRPYMEIHRNGKYIRQEYI